MMLHSAIGMVNEIAGTECVLTAKGEAGFALFGPYTALEPGNYRVKFRVKIANDTAGDCADDVLCCVVDVAGANGANIIARMPVLAGTLRRANYEIGVRFTIAKAGSVEFRVYATGRAPLLVETARSLAGPIEDQNQTPNVVKAVILFEGRCGSSHLTELLAQHPNGAFFGEELHTLKENGWSAQRDWIAKIFSMEEHNGKPLKLAGFKTKLRAIDTENRRKFLEILDQNNVRVIRMYRQNIVKQAISAERAHDLVTRYNIYNVPADRPDVERSKKTPISKDQLCYWLNYFNQEEPKIDQFIIHLPRRVKSILVSYEELLYARQDTIDRTYKFLGLEPHYAIRDIFIKNTDDDLRNAIENYEEVRDWISSTRYSGMVENSGMETPKDGA